MPKIFNLKVGDVIDYGEIKGTVTQTGPNPKRILTYVFIPGATVKNSEGNEIWYPFFVLNKAREKKKLQK